MAFQRIKATIKEVIDMGYARFTGTCVCGEMLEPAFHPEYKFVFWNCFRCFPVFPRASKKQSNALFRTWRRIKR